MVAFGQSDLAVHTVGAQAAWANSVGKGDVDLLVGERLRWSVTDSVRLWADARFLIDPDGQPLFERYRVRKLAAQVELGSVTLWLGRHPVHMGGPRLVDGVQALVQVERVELGVWGGLAPDLFTTAPRIRPGFGPMLAFTNSQIRASLVGDVLFSDGLDRVGSLASARYTPSRVFSIDTRWDVELVSAAGGPRLVDGRFGLSVRPTEAFRVSAFYNAFSSLQYLNTESLDPELRRFDSRILAQGLADGFDQDQRDSFVNHMVGLDIRARPTGDSIAPVAQLTTRYRFHPDPSNRFARVSAQVGLTRIGGRVELDALATIRQVDSSTQTDLGGQLLVDLGDGCCQIDTSALALINPDRYSGPGFYADLFTDVISEGGLAIGVGLNAIIEPLDETELGLAGFARVSYYQR